jgi:hypothetical protein
MNEWSVQTVTRDGNRSFRSLSTLLEDGQYNKLKQKWVQ